MRWSAPPPGEYVGQGIMLLLLMIPFGAGNLGWMLLLGAVMAIEKNSPWGQRVSKHIGIGLFVLAVVVAIVEVDFL